jgi:hypothetical protein
MPENLKKSIIKTFATEWFLYIFFLIIITIFIVFTIIFERQQVIKREENRLSTQVKIVNDNILMQIYSVNEAFKNIKIVIDKKNDLISNLKLFVNVIPSVRTFLIMDKNGDIIASSRDDLITFNYSSRDYFKIVKNNPVENKLFISSPYISVLGTLNINIATPFFDENKNFAGIILAAFDPDALSNLLTSVIYEDDMKASGSNAAKIMPAKFLFSSKKGVAIFIFKVPKTLIYGELINSLFSTGLFFTILK